MDSPPENRARTVGLCKRLGIWPLDTKHRAGTCLCATCFPGDSVDELAPLRVKRAKPSFPWEDGYEAA